MKTEVIPLEYETVRVRIGLDGYKKYDPKQLLHPDVFVRTQNARDLRKGRVRHLRKVLEDGKNFAGVWLVNHRGSKLRNIDGNHRWHAMNDFLTRNPEKVVEVEMHVYENLSEEEERTKFTEANNSANQTTADYLQQYKKTINIWRYINKKHDEKQFPIKVSHYTHLNSQIMALHNLYQPYLTKDEVPYNGAFVGRPIDFIRAIQDWNLGQNQLNKDGLLAYNTMRAFLNDYISAFGKMSSTTKMYWKMGIMQPLFKIWYDNKSHMNPEDMVKAFKRLKSGEGLALIQYYSSKGASRSNVTEAVPTFLQEINGTRKTKRMYVRHFLKGRGEVKRYGIASYK